MKVAIYNNKQQRIEYITRISMTYKGAEITTRLECITNHYNAIPLDRLVDSELYTIGSDEMKDIMIEIDMMYTELFDTYVPKESKR